MLAWALNYLCAYITDLPLIILTGASGIYYRTNRTASMYMWAKYIKHRAHQTRYEHALRRSYASGVTFTLFVLNFLVSPELTTKTACIGPYVPVWFWHPLLPAKWSPLTKLSLACIGESPLLLTIRWAYCLASSRYWDCGLGFAVLGMALIDMTHRNLSSRPDARISRVRLAINEVSQTR